jgi:hypothetical protein
MKGIVFNLLEDVTTATQGEDAWDELLADANLHGAYTSLGSYPDEHFFQLIASASGRQGRPLEHVIRSFGRSAIPLLANAYPEFFAPHQTTKHFLGTLNEIIHPEVRKIYPGADVPDFGMVPTETGLTMTYGSRRRLCSFAEGLIEGAADHYGEQLSIVQPRCMNRGDDTCELEITFG